MNAKELPLVTVSVTSRPARHAPGDTTPSDSRARTCRRRGSALKRKLAQYGATYSALLDEIRLRDALRLLEGTRLPVDEIAARIGYTDRANFTRAFKRWTGVAPSERR